MELVPPITGLAEDELHTLRFIISSALSEYPRLKIRVVDPHRDHYVDVRRGREDSGATIYFDAVRRATNADLTVPIVWPSATGVGIVSKVHSSLRTPRLLIVHSTNPLSRMLEALPSLTIDEIVASEDSDALRAAIWETLDRSLPFLTQHAARRRRCIRQVLDADLMRPIHRQRLGVDRMTVDNYVEQAKPGLIANPDWLREILKSHALTPSLTLLQFVSTANSLGFAVDSDGEVPCLKPHHPDPMEPTIRESLENLLVACGDREWSSDEKAVDLWGAFVAGTQAADHRARGMHVTATNGIVSREEWDKTLFPTHLPGVM